MVAHARELHVETYSNGNEWKAIFEYVGDHLDEPEIREAWAQAMLRDVAPAEDLQPKERWRCPVWLDASQELRRRTPKAREAPGALLAQELSPEQVMSVLLKGGDQAWIQRRLAHSLGSPQPDLTLEAYLAYRVMQENFGFEPGMRHGSMQGVDLVRTFLRQRLATPNADTQRAVAQTTAWLLPEIPEEAAALTQIAARACPAATPDFPYARYQPFPDWPPTGAVARVGCGGGWVHLGGAGPRGRRSGRLLATG